MANEKTFVEALKRSAKKLDPRSFVWKTNDRNSVGIPDLYLVIHGTSVHLEAKVSAVDTLEDPSRNLLKHCFQGAQIGVMRQLQNAQAIVGGIVRVSRRTAFIIDPFDIPEGGQVTGRLLMDKAYRCTHDGTLWRIDEWISKRIGDLSFHTQKRSQ